MARPKSSPAEVAERRQRIVAGARRCFAEFGFDGTTVEHLEHHCGATRGTLFRYFRSKAAMLAAVVCAETAAQQPQYEALVAGSGLNFTDVLEAMVLLQLRRVAVDPVPTRLRIELWNLARRSPKLVRGVRQMEERQRQWRQKLLQQARQLGLLHPDWDLEAAADLIATVFLGLAVERALLLPRRTGDAAHARAAAEMLAGLLQQPPSQAARRRSRIPSHSTGYN